MASINENTNIKSCDLEIHTDPVINYNEFNELFKINQNDKNADENYNFGILKLEMKETEITQNQIFLEFSVDRSGSMDELCKDNNTKMHHVKKTLVNIIEYIATLDNANVYIQIDIFDDRVDTCIEYVKVDKNNYMSLIDIVNDIKSTGSTNIGAALENAKDVITKKIEENPLIKPYHIFLTDGYATIGISNTALLMDFICNDYTNIMIGIGTQHNYKMLQNFASKQKSEYRFIDNGENSGLVYGEVLQKILRPAIEDVELSIEDGEFYDWKTNNWTNVLYEDAIDSEATKIYHIRTKELYYVEVEIKARVSCSNTIHGKQLLCEVEPVPDLEDYHTNETYYTNLSKYIYRQKTLELLSLCKDYKKERYSIEAREILKLLSKFFKNMRKYMRENKLLNDCFMTMLCEDIVVAYKTLGSQDSQMYCGARQVSQGSQYAYTPGYDKDTVPLHTNAPIKRNVFRRSVNLDAFPNINADWNDDELNETIDLSKLIEFATMKQIEEDENKDEDDIENYISSNSSSTANTDMNNFVYSTPGKTQTMRSISKN
jgi:uncharacterized protein YegL